MYGGILFAASLRVARTDRHVVGAANLLIKEDLAGELLDALIGANSEFAHPTSPRICFKRIQQEFLILGGAGFDHAIFFKGQFYTCHFTGHVDGGIRHVLRSNLPPNRRKSRRQEY